MFPSASASKTKLARESPDCGRASSKFSITTAIGYKFSSPGFAYSPSRLRRTQSKHASFFILFWLVTLYFLFSTKFNLPYIIFL